MAEEDTLTDAPTRESLSDVSPDGSPDNSSQSSPAGSSPTEKEKINLEDMFDDEQEDSEFPSSSLAPPELEYASQYYEHSISR